MNKIYVFIIVLFFVKTNNVLAQEINPGFEKLTSNGKVSYWGSNLVTIIRFDSLGHSHADSIVYDKELNFASTDAHSGKYALEMRNAYNYTAQSGIAGSVDLFDDSDFSSFSNVVEVNKTPDRLSFYFKYFPVQDDSAFATIAVYDSLSYLIGEAKVLIGLTASQYTFISAPITYSSSNSAKYISVSMSTQLPNKQPHFGTRFLVDDVSLYSASKLMDISANRICIYPNPTSHYLNIISETDIKLITLTDVSGKQIPITFVDNKRLDCSFLSSGIYFLNVMDTTGNYTHKINVE